MIKGFDCFSRLTFDQAVKLRNMGYTFAIRYCIPSRFSNSLTTDEVTALHSAGLAIGLCWETTADRAKTGAAGGAIDGQKAKACAQQLSAPEDTVIFFAVDFDAKKNDYAAITNYMIAAQTACRPYRLGVYGSYSVIEEMSWQGIGAMYWQCPAWSGGKWSAASDIQQREWSVKTGVVEVDNNYVNSLDGFWAKEEKPLFYKFSPAEMGIYHNAKKRSMEQIAAELNCDVICNLNLFNSNWTGACYTRADGKVVGSDGYGYYGFGFDRNDKTFTRAWSGEDHHANFFGCYDLIVGGKSVQTSTPAWTSGFRRRTVIGMCSDGQPFIYCNTQTETVGKLAEFLLAHGVTEAIVLDGGGSTQCKTPAGNVVSSDKSPRRVHTLFWANLTEKPLVCPYTEPTSNIRWGSIGEGARWVQWQLKRKGYDLTVDGVFLNASTKALKDFQLRNNLVVDGVCGEITRGMLKA